MTRDDGGRERSEDLEAAARSWDSFYRERRDLPFLANVPDESLAAWVEDRLLTGTRALDAGCGLGRNAIYLAARGFAVDAVEVSTEALARARSRAADAGVSIAFHAQSFLDAPLPAAGFDLAVDGGCLHHVRPTLREAWLARHASLLRLGGRLALTAFAPESGAPVIGEDDGRDAGSRTGYGFTAEGLHELLSVRFEVEELRRMRDLDLARGRMGVPFLWAVRARLR